jgi:HK97 family phage portal protein
MANIWDRFKGLFSGRGAITGLRDPALVELFGGRMSDAGINVTESTALTCSAVWSAVRVISESAASLPLITYRVGANGARVRATGHAVYDLLRDEPCPGVGSLVWREALYAHAILAGNGYAEIERRFDGTPIALWLIAPSRVNVRRGNDARIHYTVTQPNGGQIEIPAYDMLHLRGLGGDGTIGYSVVRMARESIGLTMATEKFGAKFFGAGARPTGVLEHPGRLSDDARLRLRADYERLHSGIENAHRVAILEEGMKWSTSGTPPDDAQFLQTRQFQVSEIARWFNIPASKLRDTSGQTYSSMEAENLAFLTETLRPWLIRFEQELACKLLNPAEKKVLYFEHLVDGMLRADQAARYAAYAIGRNWGWLSVNEIRARENLEPVDGGDQYLQPLNMQALSAPSGASAPSSTPALGVVATVDAVPTAVDATAAATAPSVDVAATALNGAQIASLVDLVAQVGAGTIPVDSAKAIAGASFPFLSPQIIAQIFDAITPALVPAPPSASESAPGAVGDVPPPSAGV